MKKINLGKRLIKCLKFKRIYPQLSCRQVEYFKKCMEKREERQKIKKIKDDMHYMQMKYIELEADLLVKRVKNICTVKRGEDSADTAIYSAEEKRVGFVGLQGAISWASCLSMVDAVNIIKERGITHVAMDIHYMCAYVKTVPLL